MSFIYTSNSASSFAGDTVTINAAVYKFPGVNSGQMDRIYELQLGSVANQFTQGQMLKNSADNINVSLGNSNKIMVVYYATSTSNVALSGYVNGGLSLE